MRDRRERGEVEIRVEVAVDVFDHRMHAPVVLGLAAARGGQSGEPVNYRPR